MHYMTFVERSNPEHNDEISFWVNDKGKVFFEIQPEGGTNDAYEYRCLALGKDDVLKMISELQRLVDEYELEN